MIELAVVAAHADGAGLAQVVQQEALGLALPGNGTIPAVYSERIRLAKDAGRAIMHLVEKKIRPRDIVTREALENAFAVDVALGGSTNTCLHIPAIAHSAGFEMPLSRIDAISRRTPHICSMSPGGRYFIADLYRAGGIPTVMSRLMEGNLISGSPMTVTGTTVAENIASRAVAAPFSSSKRNSREKISTTTKELHYSDRKSVV